MYAVDCTTDRVCHSYHLSPLNDRLTGMYEYQSSWVKPRTNRVTEYTNEVEEIKVVVCESLEYNPRLVSTSGLGEDSWFTNTSTITRLLEFSS